MASSHESLSIRTDSFPAAGTIQRQRIQWCKSVSKPCEAAGRTSRQPFHDEFRVMYLAYVPTICFFINFLQISFVHSVRIKISRLVTMFVCQSQQGAFGTLMQSDLCYVLISHSAWTSEFSPEAHTGSVVSLLIGTCGAVTQLLRRMQHRMSCNVGWTGAWVVSCYLCCG